MLANIQDLAQTKQKIEENKEEIIHLANSFHPRMLARGGGAKDLEVLVYPERETKDQKLPSMAVVHLLVDTKDAMGANLVNTMCEGVSPLIEKLTEHEVSMRILSNLADRSMVRATVRIPLENLEGKGFSGAEVRDGIVLANQFAMQSPYRATTHNKGVMNGIDAVALATGNDWRAIEASCHAYAVRGGQYSPLTEWKKNEEGDLIGVLEAPLKVGTVGGPIQAHPRVQLAYKIMNLDSARELACLMGAAGLAQNFAALKALSTEGIQKGHMSLHARSVASAAAVPEDFFEEVVEGLIHSKEIKVWKAKELLENLKDRSLPPGSQKSKERSVEEAIGHGSAPGKVILTGEHAVVYGAHGLAAPINLHVHTTVTKLSRNHAGIEVVIPRWGVEEFIEFKDGEKAKKNASIFDSLKLILIECGLTQKSFRLEVSPQVPRGVGLGSSSALMVSIIRALMDAYQLDFSDDRVSDLAYLAEEVVHGRASGIDNTVSSLDRMIIFKKGESDSSRSLVRARNSVEEVHGIDSLPFVVGVCSETSMTSAMVEKVRNNREKNPDFYERLIREIDQITVEAVKAIQAQFYEKLGDLMNINQGLLNAMQVSHPNLERMCEIARQNGAFGAKLTGAGGGGAIIALCPENRQEVVSGLKREGFRAFTAEINGHSRH
jgi:hydroxymethylglutaryl-CoA reductase